MAWTDDEIIGAILAGGGIRPIKARRRWGWGFGRRSYDDIPQGPVCAVSAGILFRGVETTTNPLRAFAERYGVPYAVAEGVSDGFEDLDGDFDGSFSKHKDSIADYQRGWAIGAAVRSAIEEE